MEEEESVIFLSKTCLNQDMTTHNLPSDQSATVVSSSIHLPPPPARWHHETSTDTNSTTAPPHVRLMCSFGGRILPRPHDHQLRYVGGDTRIVALHRHSSFSALLSKLSKLAPNSPSDGLTIKYQLPNEDIDALITVTSDEDVDNMMEEYDRLVQSYGISSNSRSTTRLRLFLFPTDTESGESGGFGSVLSGTGGVVSKHETWFLDALNGRPLERGRSEASSILSEVPDYFFGLDNNSDEPAKPKTNVSVSDPGSPAPVVSSPHFGSTSSVHSVEIIKPEIVNEPAGPEVNQVGYVQQNPPVWQYANEPVPVYYMPGPAQGGSLPVRQVPMGMPYVRPPVPVAYRPVYVGGPLQVGRAGMGGGAYEYPVGMEAYHDQMQPSSGLWRNNSNSNLGVHAPMMNNSNSNMGVNNVPMFRPPAMGVVPVAGELQTMAATGSDMRIPRTTSLQ